MLDTIPSSVLTVYRKDLGDRAISAPAAVNQTLDTPLRLPHFGGEEGRLRRLALSAAINRPQICRTDLHRRASTGPRFHRQFAARLSTRTSPATTR